MPSLFQRGNFVLNSGAISTWKIECDSLSDEDIEALAEMMRKLVRPFGEVEGVPRGGLRIAAAMKEFITPDCPILLIVDDVLTTGGSMQRMRQSHADRGKEVWQIDGCVIWARGKCPPWIRAVQQLPIELWLPAK